MNLLLRVDHLLLYDSNGGGGGGGGGGGRGVCGDGMHFFLQRKIERGGKGRGERNRERNGGRG